MFQVVTLQAQAANIPVPQRPVVSQVEFPQTLDLSPAYAHTDNCYAALNAIFGGKMPPSRDLIPKDDISLNAVAIFTYRAKWSGETVSHYALVTGISTDTFNIFECHYDGDACGYRTIKKDDPNIVGFFRLL